MNILLTSSARRIDFVGFFQEALKRMGVGGNVITADPDYNAPSLQQGDISYVIPHQADSDYIEAIKKICQKHEVDCIIPLNDWEVPKLADNKKEFKDLGVSMFVPDPEVVDKVRDKGKYRELLGAFEVKAPRSYIDYEDAEKALESGEVNFPLIIKPRNGSASIGVDIAEDHEEMKLAYNNAVKQIKGTPLNDVTYKNPEDNVIIQEVVEGDKFSLDLFNDLDGRFMASFVRKQLEMRAGDVDRCITVHDQELNDIARKMGENLGHAGYINTDVYFDGKDYYVIDINPRFGGGYAFSHQAGADIPAAIIALIAGREVKGDWLEEKPDCELARHDVVVHIDEEKKRHDYSDI
ncbi:ATP-grasp domain-containing protein [Salipaludibacillus aurantiacus]|uniref:Carbamoyl-phosphate synthase large subunit n=1 Tax=Salipaludibacillus aurantiacus TaxID=1601833 RepID=A0A1H9VJF1_9BACI|nr:ATP-grasp domain-containing protein [Salipaludibacillus aurantiacus]SES21825.1 carbamoyl-phosphate synthase large subunit [Salipaludibacillus aurantiacus]